MQSACSPRSKLPDVGTTIFTVIGQLSAEHQALNLSQGAPNFAGDPQLIEATAQAMRAGHNQYAPMSGVAALRAALAEKAERLYGARYDADEEITVIASASEGLYSAISALVHPGDEVIYFEPAFDSYAPIVRLQGATPVAIKLSLQDFRVDWDEVAAAINGKTRMIIVNTPHNPTGAVFDAQDIDRLTALTRDTDIVILSDEVYEHVVFDGDIHHSMARYPQLAERSVIVSSFGKTYHVTGWRVGYCLAPAALMDEIRKVHQFMVFSADTPMQYAFAAALANPQSYLGLAAFYQQKRDLLASALQDSRFELLPSRGSFFMLARFSGFSHESDNDFAVRLIREAKVATIPLSAFYSDGTDTGLIRLSFSKDNETLLEGARRLSQV
ncbi:MULTISPECIES: pyridoxal phosphate-dependent aminotransferase [Serratia]|jgi:methionine aminotransferase|uniref:pyridoxal phosphate-dependent aminotransferase n=1 Tax=Serratia TaxID=613 RepID=UPI000EFB89A1|nr:MULTISPECIES: pyridoxal phosphate-dependent aminotransferase [Serratia]MDI6931139.1 pyridoxal phosphate-dependent aminotransferase [Serratia sp. Se-PFBMAAmG]MBH3102775.1 pyridoxal phosphate-dependent aminotransferase [Serratia marcescens]MBH3260202.1 pyridoxal phosphate-dependent aminotransferase [Serratia marcescens]MCW7608808.1 pyridoxal phosphate-dependent aminotransferase [Serratia bockelmannii]MDI6946648.1 pyridoxal phosphate-dependent aminotransferase [Serratia sp. Se-RSmG]